MNKINVAWTDLRAFVLMHNYHAVTLSTWGRAFCTEGAFIKYCTLGDVDKIVRD